MLSGQSAKGALSSKFGFAAANRFFIERGGGQVIAYAFCVSQTNRRQRYCRVVNSERLHGSSFRSGLAAVKSEEKTKMENFKKQ